jgi:hypothetical protein
MRLAYADPPYPGQAARHYGKNGDPYAGDVAEVDHGELIARLGEYDGWALSTSMPALRDVLPLAPAAAVVAVWHVTNAGPPGARRFQHHYSWEPVIVVPARPRPDVKNVLATPKLNGFLGGQQLVGQKPPLFSEWVFALMGAEPDDTLDDVFPGSGAVGEAWRVFTTQLRIPLAGQLTLGGPGPSSLRNKNSRIRRARENAAAS